MREHEAGGGHLRPDAPPHGQAVGAAIVHNPAGPKTRWDKYKLGSVISFYVHKGMEVSLRREGPSKSALIECELTFSDACDVAIRCKRHVDTAFPADPIPLILKSVQAAMPGPAVPLFGCRSVQLGARSMMLLPGVDDSHAVEEISDSGESRGHASSSSSCSSSSSSSEVAGEGDPTAMPAELQSARDEELLRVHEKYASLTASYHDEYRRGLRESQEPSTSWHHWGVLGGIRMCPRGLDGKPLLRRATTSVPGVASSGAASSAGAAGSAGAASSAGAAVISLDD